MTEWKQTQGNKKLNQMIGDLKRNDYFVGSLKKIEKYLAEQKFSDVRKEDKIEGKITDRLMDLDKELKDLASYFKKNRSKTENLIQTLIEKYAIDPDLIIDLSVGRLTRNDHENIGEIYDMCRVTDYWDVMAAPEFGDPPMQLDIQAQRGIEVYPIHLEIHRLATKRDVLDFIEKRWGLIESFIDAYREKKPRIRQRKLPREISDFIWENRNLGQKKISELLNEKFPKNDLIYNEVYKIISLERKRRQGKISVGQ
jgi:hypothetical protein